MIPLSRHLPGISSLAFGCMGLGGSWDSNTTTTEQQQHAFFGLAVLVSKKALACREKLYAVYLVAYKVFKRGTVRLIVYPAVNKQAEVFKDIAHRLAFAALAPDFHGEVDDVVPLSAVLDWARPQSLPVTVVPGVGHFFHGQLPLLKSLVVRAFDPTKV